MPSAISRAKARPSRGSTSSPFARNSTPNTTTRNDAWVEPELQENKASYEDHGGSPYGVLEDMQALGQRPNAKVKGRVKADPLRKLVGKNAGLAHDATDTPEGTPAVETPRSASVAVQEVPSPKLPPPPADDEEDEDYRPKAGAKRVSRRRSSKPTVSETRPVSNTPIAVPSPAAPITAQTPRDNTTSHAGMAEPLSEHRLPNLGVIVKAAMERARDVGNDDLGQAINHVYLESQENQRLTYLIRSILVHTASAEEQKEFKNEISRAKRLLKERKGKRPATDDHMLDASNDAQRRLESPNIAPSRSSVRPEAVPRASIESSAEVPKLKISIRHRASEKKPAAEGPSSKVNGTASAQRPRTGSQSTSSSLSSIASEEADHVAVDSKLLLPPAQTKAQRNSLKRTSVEAELAMDDREQQLAIKKQKFAQTLYKDPPPQEPVMESHIRDEQEGRRGLRRQAPMDHQAGPAMTDGTAINGRRRVATESPLSDLSTPPASRRGTPRTAATGRSIKKAKTKQSPEKKQAAGLVAETEGSGGRRSPVPFDDDESSENNDFCNSCGGTGYLVCCDGCDKSFHFTCLDPPLSSSSSELEEPWFCHVCVAKRDGPQKQPRGLFSQLLHGLEKSNPTIFALPPSIRDYFEGVGTGKDGKFAEPTNVKTRSRNGYDEPLDLLKTKDSKGNAILCYQCSKSAAGRREMITCDACSQHWHLDCLDPPLSNPPFRDQYNRKIREWICPLHIEHDLRRMDTSRLARQRTVHMRHPKQAKIVDTSLRRGHFNHGLVEIVEESSSEDESEFEEDETPSGTIYRLPAKGVKLDFIHKIREDRITHVQAENPAKRVCLDPSGMRRGNFTKRSFAEQRTALSLVRFAQQNNDLALSADRVENLVGTLIAEAPANVVEEFARTEAVNGQGQGQVSSPSPSDKQREELLLLQELIKRKLAGSNDKV